MSVIVKLPREVSGQELSDAIEEAGRKIGWFVDRKREICYEPGSVKQKELNSSIKIAKPKEVKEEDAKDQRGLLDILTRRPKEMVTNTVLSETSFRIKLSAEDKFESISFGIAVEVANVTYTCGYHTWITTSEITTSDPRFAKEIQPAFEQFLTHLFELLRQESPAVG